MRACSSLIVLSLVCSFTAAHSALGRSAAMLPVSAEGVTLDELPALERLDQSLRAALAADGSLILQPKSVTLAHLGSARDVGLSCSTSDTACLGKLAILAEVELLVVTSASTRSGGFDVRLSLVEAGGVRRDVEAALPPSAPALDEAAQALVERLFAAPPTPAVAVQEPVPAPDATVAQGDDVSAPVARTAEPARPVDVTPAEDDDGSSWLLVGGAAAAGALVVGAGLVAGVALLAFPPAPEGPAVIVMP